MTGPEMPGPAPQTGVDNTPLSQGVSPQVVPTDSASISSSRFAWRDRRVAGLGTFRPMLQSSIFSGEPLATQLLSALDRFQTALDSEFRPAQLLERSAPLRALNPRVADRPYRFYFTPSVMRGEQVLVTVFMEAHPEELAERPNNYGNTNKHLHNGFLTANGIFRKSEGEFERDKWVAQSFEHTAYAKFYLTLWGGSPAHGISMLIYPLQNVRLGYRAALDAGHDTYRQRLHVAAGCLKRLIDGIKAGRIVVHGAVGAHEQLNFLEGLRADLNRLFVTHNKADFVKLVREVSPRRAQELGLYHNPGYRLAWLTDYARIAGHRTYYNVDALHAQTIADGPRQTIVHLRRDIWRLLRDMQHVANVIELEGKEVAYHHANARSGEERACLLLGLSDILRSCLHRATDQPVYRFMLASDQIDQIRLKNPRGHVRERIKDIAKRLERYYPTADTAYPLFPVDENGHVGDETEKQPVKVISLDGGAFIKHRFLMKRPVPRA
ncbi:MAG: hypothetical protein K1X79_05885 [Oligoflexia bacterium]|nr:hypothetical protein [Oligoflexia bacterium]